MSVFVSATAVCMGSFAWHRTCCMLRGDLECSKGFRAKRKNLLSATFQEVALGLLAAIRFYSHNKLVGE